MTDVSGLFLSATTIWELRLPEHLELQPGLLPTQLKCTTGPVTSKGHRKQFDSGWNIVWKTNFTSQSGPGGSSNKYPSILSSPSFLWIVLDLCKWGAGVELLSHVKDDARRLRCLFSTTSFVSFSVCLTSLFYSELFLYLFSSPCFKVQFIQLYRWCMFDILYHSTK